MLSAAGAVIGYGLGLGGAAIIRALSGLACVSPDWAVLAALGTALVTGLVFCVLPARRAARSTRCWRWRSDDLARCHFPRAARDHRTGLRSFLTLLGIAVGIAAVILLTSIGEGIHRFVLAEFSQFGTNVVGVAPGRVKTAGGPPRGLPTAVRPLTFDDARALQRPPHVIGVAPTVWGNSEVAGNGRLRRTTSTA